MVNRVGAGFCPEPQPAGPHHIARDSVTDDLDRILMQDQPSKFYYVITGAHGVHNSSSFAFLSAHQHLGRVCTQQDPVPASCMNTRSKILYHPWQLVSEQVRTCVALIPLQLGF